MNPVMRWVERLQRRYSYRLPAAIWCTAGLIAITGIWAVADSDNPRPGSVSAGPGYEQQGGDGDVSAAGEGGSSDPSTQQGGKGGTSGTGGDAGGQDGGGSGGGQQAGGAGGGPAGPAAGPAGPAAGEAACPEGFDKGVCTGLTADTIRVGSHVADTQCGTPIPDTSDEREAEPEDWINYINKIEGGIHGRQLQLFEADDGYCPEMAGQAARKLIDEDRVFTVQGFLGVDQNRTVADYAQGRGVPYIAGGGPAEWAGRWDVFHQGQSSYDVMYPALLKYIIGKSGMNKPDAKIGMMYVDTDDVSEPTKRAFKAVPKANVVEAIPLAQGIKQNFLEEIRALRAAGADVVFCHCHPLNMVAFVQQADAQQYKPQYTFVSQGQDLDLVLRLFPGDSTWAKNAKGLSNFCHPTHPCAKPYEAKLKKVRPDVIMSQVGLIGIHAFEMWAEPMRRIGRDLNRGVYTQALRGLEGWTTGLTAPVDLDPDRSVGIQGFAVYQSPGTGSRNYEMVNAGGQPFRNDW
jgi:ABC-type branched-subunit amino acid transport system substrate-binding protein